MQPPLSRTAWIMSSCAGPPDRTVVTATVSAERGDAGIKIVSSKLSVTAYGLKGADQSQFVEIAKEAEGRCPVSNAYRASMQITVEAKVA